MSRFGALRNRLLPAVLTALGVSLIAGGLLTYTGAVQPAPEADASEIIVTASPTPTPQPSVVLPTIPPPGTLEPTASPAIPADRVGTRVVVPALKIDLPIVKGPANKVLCNVAMYAEAPGLVQPGFPGSFYLYGHARKGMFLPLLDQSKKRLRKRHVETREIYNLQFEIVNSSRGPSPAGAFRRRPSSSARQPCGARR